MCGNITSSTTRSQRLVVQPIERGAAVPDCMHRIAFSAQVLDEPGG